MSSSVATRWKEKGLTHYRKEETLYPDHQGTEQEKEWMARNYRSAITQAEKWEGKHAHAPTGKKKKGRHNEKDGSF